MPHIERDLNGAVSGVYVNRQVQTTEELPEDDPEVVAFRKRSEGKEPLTAEELYDVLERKNVLTAADRPRPKP